MQPLNDARSLYGIYKKGNATAAMNPNGSNPLLHLTERNMAMDSIM
jgi:hypothetical protein